MYTFLFLSGQYTPVVCPSECVLCQLTTNLPLHVQALFPRNLSFFFLSLIFSLPTGKAIPKHRCLLSWEKKLRYFRSQFPLQSLLLFLFLLYALNVSLLPLCQVSLNFLSDHLSLDHLLSTEVASTTLHNTFLENFYSLSHFHSPLHLYCP